MRKWKIASIASLCLMLVSTIACNPFGGGNTGATEQQVEVTRGNLIISVSGSGNTRVTSESNLTFGVSGRIKTIYIEEGDNVTAGEVLAELDTSPLELALTQARVAYTRAQMAVTDAQISLQTAKLNLDKAENLYKWPELKVAQSEVERARASVEYAESRLASAPADQQARWTEMVGYAIAYLITKEDELNTMLAGGDPEEIAIKKLQVSSAEQSLTLAQQSVEQAQQSIDEAQRQLDDAKITAPFDGTVASVSVKEKDSVTAFVEAIHLIDPGKMEIEVEVDEIDIAEVRQGQKAMIEMDALPSLSVNGTVNRIRPLPTESSGVTVYNVKINFEVPEGSEVRAGMSATADIVTNERNNVLLVPDRAIQQDSNGNPVVLVMVGKQTEERPVVVGISDGFDTEIIGGLKEGDMVVIKQTTTSTTGGLF